MNGAIAVSRARIFVLIESFESDLRKNLEKFVVAEIGIEATYDAQTLSRVSALRDSDESASSNLSHYLNLREAWDQLARHRSLLPEALSREVRESTQNLDRIVQIRNRVMHGRPLAAGDSDAAVSLLIVLISRFWPELNRTFDHLRSDPAWEPIRTPMPNVGNEYVLHNLPLADYDETGLVGRDEEVQKLVSLLRRRRENVVTVTGEGGIGKTALALEAAYVIADSPDSGFDAVLWTSLKYEKLTASGVTEIRDAARSLAGAMNPIAETLDDGLSSAFEELADALTGINALVVIDNLETVGSEDFEVLYDVLPDSVTYLLTSRVGVGQFERRFPIGPLLERDALRLFNDFVRSRRIDSLKSISSETRRIVVQKLRNSPLALKWFALAVEQGSNPVDILHNQDELLEFCVRSVYDGLSPASERILVALVTLSRAVTLDELVVLLDASSDYVNAGLQELLRGALVRRESSTISNNLTLRVAPTETAVKFLDSRIRHVDDVREDIRTRDAEFREIEERRARDLADRSLAPIVVRTRTSADSPTAQILRGALLASRDGDWADAKSKLDIARRLNPDFWEVDRVDGYISAVQGDLERAAASYERAYSSASGEARGVVCHFYAGFLARRARNVKLALRYAAEANEILQQDDTAVALGTYQVWAHSFDEGIRHIEPVLATATGKIKLIAASTLADAYKRWAEFSWAEERNALRQFSRAAKGFLIAVAAMESGVVDMRLRNSASECAVEALRGVNHCTETQITVTGLSDWIQRLDAHLIRLHTTEYWPFLGFELGRALRTRSAAAIRAHASWEALDSASSEPSTSSAPSSRRGEIVSLQSNYGFIMHPDYPGNIFFHESDLADPKGFASLRSGSVVTFAVTEAERGPRAIGVEYRL